MKILRPETVTVVSNNVPETEYSAWVVGTTYPLDYKVIKNHKVWESLQSANVGHDPEELESTWWAMYSYTNAWKMFDSMVGSQTAKSPNINLTFYVSRASGLCLMNLEADSVTVTMTDIIEGVVYNETIDTIASTGVIDLFTYFFEPFTYVKNLYLALPTYLNTTVTVLINYPADTAKCGEIVFGIVSSLGCTQFGAGVGITDYSIKQADDFGNYTILERAFSKRGSFNLTLQNQTIDHVLTLFETYRATPVVWIPTEEDYLESPFIIYGYYRDFQITANSPSLSDCSLELEGLT